MKADLHRGAGTGRQFLLLFCVLLAACSATTTKEPGLTGLDRQQFLESIHVWSFTGRVALSDGKDGGSGSLEWRQDESALNIEFRGALGRGAWMLESTGDHAKLQTGKGDTFQSHDATYLVSRHVGWQVPMDALPYWVRGLAVPGSQAQIVSGEDGLPQSLSQLDWQISYGRWEADYEPVMPVRITASRGQYSLKLIVRHWDIPATL